MSGQDLSSLTPRLSFSYVAELSPEPQHEEHEPNQKSREVRSGHYVLVAPTPLPTPVYVAHSPGLVALMDLPDAVASDDETFRKFFTGNLSVVQQLDGFMTKGWATGYALSIYGTEYTSNCPFRNGNGYGDGRAMSVLELALPNHAADAATARRPQLEFQLKGGGRTPYCRGGDGRAVLRSSVREFIASEAMHALGVPTARSLCLFVSASERVMRPWYTPGSTSEDPDQMISERTAITTRVAPSFIRVGQLELFARRARRPEVHPTALRELEQLVQHLVRREYPELLPPNGTLSLETAVDVKEALYLRLAEAFANRLSRLVAEWIRVGYCQGNFNADNCAAGGWTLDYGPFGFVEEYSPTFQMWVGGGDHFSFMHQPTAAAMNYKMFCMSLAPLLRDDAKQSLSATLRAYALTAQKHMETMLARKMGLLTFRGNLWSELDALLQETGVDWTIFWRLLSDVPTDIAALRQAAFYEGHGVVNEARWTAWLDAWLRYLKDEGRPSGDVVSAMKQANPKYIPREWMLREAYQETEGVAEGGDGADADTRPYAQVRRLQRVLERPYDEQADDVAARYFRKKPEALFGIGGVSHCSCSS